MTLLQAGRSLHVLTLLAAACLATTNSQADQFQDLADSFGTMWTLAGVHHATTLNPDGSSINFWTPSSEGAVASTVGLSNPHMAAADGAGNIYIADKAGEAVLKIATNGLIHTFAGTHVGGFNGDGPAPATSLQISRVNGLFVLPDGTVYLLDPGNHRIRRVGTDGVMTTIVNDLEPNWYPSGRALWVSPDEQLIYYTHEFRPVPPGIIADGAAVKRWTATNGIETLCSRRVGLRNPGNIDVNPVDGKLYVTDRAEEDISKLATGVFRIDGPDQLTRITGNLTKATAADGRLAVNSYIDGPRGIAFRPDGSYFLCAHKDGNVWFVDTTGILHLYLRGKGSKDSYTLGNGFHPPLTAADYFAQPRAVTLAPNGDLLVVCNDSGYVFRVESGPPLIRNGPILPTAHFGSNVTLSVAIAASGRLGYQWYRDDVAILGATNANLSLSNLVASDRAAYAVKVSNARGSVTSSNSTLAILPVITGQPQSVTVSAGAPASFSVEAAGVPPLRFQWYREPLVPIPGGTGSVLLIPGVAAAELGNYFVRVTSPGNGSVESLHVTLSAPLPPVISGQPTGLTVSLAQSAALSVAATGTEPLRYQWFLGGLLLPAETEAVLSIPRAGAADAGNYQVIITNFIGATTSELVTLTVQLPPNAPKPVVTMSSPPAVFSRVTSNVLTVAGVAASAAGVDEVFVRAGTALFAFESNSNQMNWQATVPLNPGSNVISAIVVDLLGHSATNSKVVFYIAPAPLSLGVSPADGGTVRGATNGQRLEAGKGYTLTAVPAAGFVFSNWTGGVTAAAPVLDFIMRSNLALNANFVPNPFPPWAGSYHGLYSEPTDPRHERRGLFSAAVRPDGGFSGRFQNGARAVPFTGRFDLEGRATILVRRSGSDPVTIEITLDLHGANTITGRVVTALWASGLRADRAVFTRTNPSPFTNRFTLLFPGAANDEGLPSGHGFGTAVVDRFGNLKFSGVLADGTPVSQAVPITGAGDWPLYLPLYGGRGSVFGWVNFTNPALSELGGLVNWFRPPLSPGTFFTNGFHANSRILGSAYAPPGTNRLVDLDSAVVAFTGDAFPGTSPNTIAFGPSGRITNTGPNKLVISTTPATGLLKGSYTPLGTNKVLAFKGVMLQKQRFGGGHHLGPDAPGGVYLGP